MVYFEHNVHPRLELAEEQEILAENARHAAEHELQLAFQRDLGNAAVEVGIAFRRDDIFPPNSAAGRATEHARLHGWPSVFRCMAMAVQNHDAFIDRR